MTKPKVIDITNVIDPMLEDESTVNYIRNRYKAKYLDLVKDFDDEDNAATYYLICYYLCKEYNADHFMISGDIFTLAQ